MADKYTDERIDAIRLTARHPGEQAEQLAKEARSRVEANVAATQKFREQRREDREFIEFQYDDEAIDERKQGRKPALQVHLVNERIQEVMHKYRESGIGFRVASATSETGDDAAKAFNGLAARDQRDSLSEAEMERVILEAVYYGEGWGTWDEVDAEGMLDSGAMRYENGRMEFSEEASLGMFDRTLRMRACDAERIYEDPTDDTPDRRNLNWLVETEQITLEERNSRYPKAARLPLSVFDAGDSWFPEHNVGQGPKRDQMVVIARYYRRRLEKIEYVWHPTFGDKTIREDRLSPEQKQTIELDPMQVRRYTRNAPIIELIVTDGLFVLEGPTVLPYTTIPYFRAVNTEERLEDGERIKRGYVYRLRDMCAAMSVGLSDVFWKTAIAGTPGWIAPADAVQAYPRDWGDTTRPKNVRQYDQYTRYPGGDGNPQPLQPPQYVSPTPDQSGSMEMLSATRDMIGATAGAADPQQRDVNAQHRSGVALDRMERMAAASRSLPIWNAEKITTRRAAEIWLMKARYTYDRIGRRLIVAGESPSKPDEGWLVGVPFVRHPSTGALIPVTTTPDQMTYPLPGTEDANGVPRTLQIHRFNPATDAVKVATHAQSLNAAGNDAYAETLGQMAAALPDHALILLKASLHAMADRFPVDEVLKELDAVSPPAADTGQTDIMALPGQFRQLQQQFNEQQQMMQQLQEAANQTNAAKEIASLRAQTDSATAQLKAQVDQIVAQMKVDADLQKTRIVTEQREDAAILAAATKRDSDETAAEVTAFVEGVKQQTDDDAGEKPEKKESD